MSIQVASIRWAAAQEALREAVSRVTALLRSGLDPDAPAIGDWTLAEAAMHLSQAWVVVPGMARRDLSRIYDVLPEMKGAAGESLIRELWDLGQTTKMGVAADRERDLRTIADRIEGRAAEFFAEAASGVADDRHAWLVEGTVVPRTVLTGHLLNETLVHGYDIARAGKRPWPIEPAHSAMVLTGFIVPVIQSLPRRDLVNQKKSLGRRVVYALHLRGSETLVFDFDDGELTIEPFAGQRVDCHISADSTGMLLVGWARRSQWSAIARGQLIPWGRKPWLALQFRTLLRNP